MKKELEKILCGDLEEERVEQILGLFGKRVELLRRRLHAHARGQLPHISEFYVDARIDDLMVELAPM